MTDDERANAVALRAAAIDRILEIHRVPWSMLTVTAILWLAQHKVTAARPSAQLEMGLDVHAD